MASHTPSSITATESAVTHALAEKEEARYSDAQVADPSRSILNDEGAEATTFPPLQQISSYPPTNLPTRVRDTDTSSISSTRSIYYSVCSGLSSTISFFSPSSGRPSQDGSTWRQSLSLTMNSGFGPNGAPRSMGLKRVREGRERGMGLPRDRGVGRTGKGPVKVPKSMLKALGVITEDEEEAKIRKTKEIEKRLLHTAEKFEELQTGSVRRRSKTMRMLVADIEARLRDSDETLSKDTEGAFVFLAELSSALENISVDLYKITDTDDRVWFELENDSFIHQCFSFPHFPAIYFSSVLENMGFQADIAYDGPYSKAQLKIFGTLHESVVKAKLPLWNEDLKQTAIEICWVLRNTQPTKSTSTALRHYESAIRQDPHVTRIRLKLEQEAQNLHEEIKVWLGPDLEHELQETLAVPGLTGFGVVDRT